MEDLSKGTYKYVGSMLAVSLLYGGPAPAFFAPSCVQYILRGGVDGVKASLDDIARNNIFLQSHTT